VPSRLPVWATLNRATEKAAVIWLALMVNAKFLLMRNQFRKILYNYDGFLLHPDDVAALQIGKIRVSRHRGGGRPETAGQGVLFLRL
jgi:hypothetical protein